MKGLARVPLAALDSVRGDAQAMLTNLGVFAGRTRPKIKKAPQFARKFFHHTIEAI